MASSVDALTTSSDAQDLICRGCLQEFGEMKNIYETGLDEDFFRYTDIPRKPSEGLPAYLCTACETDLRNTKNFKDRCQQSDRILKMNLTKKTEVPMQVDRPPLNKYEVTSVFSEKKLLLMITAPNQEDKILLQCPYEKCTAEFGKVCILRSHLRRTHGYAHDLEIEQQYYCTVDYCVYNRYSIRNKFFSGRKFLNQHMNKMHKDRVYVCESCEAKFPKETDYYRHLKTCNLIYLCEICQNTYSTNETYLVHLARKHPSLHAKYKLEKRAQKRSAVFDTNKAVVPPKIVKLKKTSANVTITEIVEKIKQECNKRQRNGLAMLEIVSVNTKNEKSCKKVPKKPPLDVSRVSPWYLEVDVAKTAVPPIEHDESIKHKEPVEQKRSVKDEEAIKHEELVEHNETVKTEELVEHNVTFEHKDPIEKDEIKSSDSQSEENCDGDSITEEAVTLIAAATNECYNEVIAEEIVSEEVVDENVTPDVDIDIQETIEDDKDILCSEYGSEYQKKTSATQIPEHVTNDVSLNSWDNKNVFEIQTDEISTQTVFGDLLRSQQDDIFFSESVSLSDIQTQTVPIEFGLTQNKGTQSQSPGLSYKETQTNFELYDEEIPKRNFRIFDSRSSSPGPNSFNAQTQTMDPFSPIRSDVLLSCSSAETQTYLDDFRYASM